jgi:hypothetical protein
MWIYLVDQYDNTYALRKHFTTSAAMDDVKRLVGQVESDVKQSDIASFIRKEKLDFLEKFYYNPRSFGLCIDRKKPVYWFR